ncbi:hypothetical protein [Moritella sp. F3]|uniref:hypothetical protein n=1 Tax=Moritella sp. F3 TaxID=2718882 RepID=UPI001A326CD0|nr:hypothetical protein [Moritella sp. F3]GIC79425.1 hypothetical protein FMO001_41520 [Moritella sp. F1]GIC81221.1 hypothetical protein FMO003_15020 [Moritella sp. F3]
MRMLKITHTALLITLVTGCASFENKTVSTDELQRMAEINIQANQRVNDAVALVEESYLQASDENFTFYAPKTWKSVQKDIESMHYIVNRFDPSDQGFFGGPSEEKVLASVREVNDRLLQAEQTKAKVIAFLSKPLADIEYLSPKITPTWQRDFAYINKAMNKLISNIETNNASSWQATNRDKLQKKLNELEINIVTAEYYSPLEDKFDQLNQRLIPQSYNRVQQELQNLTTVITSSPRDVIALDDAANLADKYIKSAEHVSSDVDWINKLDKKQREQIVLHYRATLEDFGHKFLGQDLSDLSYKQQVNTFKLELSAMLSEFDTDDETIQVTDNAVALEDVAKDESVINAVLVDIPKDENVINTALVDAPKDENIINTALADASKDESVINTVLVDAAVISATLEGVAIETTQVTTLPTSAVERN